MRANVLHDIIQQWLGTSYQEACMPVFGVAYFTRRDVDSLVEQICAAFPDVPVEQMPVK